MTYTQALWAVGHRASLPLDLDPEKFTELNLTAACTVATLVLHGSAAFHVALGKQGEFEEEHVL